MKKKSASFYGNGDPKHDFNDFICYYCSDEIGIKAFLVECRDVIDKYGLRFLSITGICEKCEAEINRIAVGLEGYVDGPKNNDEFQVKLKEFELSLVMNS